MATIIFSASAVGLELREVRLAQGLTQTELAQRAGVGRQWLVGFEAGEKPSAPLHMVFQVLSALNTHITITGFPKGDRRG